MTAKINCLLIALIIFPWNINKSYAGDDEWRTFGEVAAVLLGVRALTGWDPIGEIVDYPRKKLMTDTERPYQPVLYRQAPHEHRSDRISAYPPEYSPSGYRRAIVRPNESRIYPPPQRAADMYATRSSDEADNVYPAEFSESQAPKDASKPTTEVKRYIDGDNEIIEKRIWIAPHWEKKVIEGHWRGDTWVETHTERKLIKGEWRIVEETRPYNNE